MLHILRRLIYLFLNFLKGNQSSQNSFSLHIITLNIDRGLFRMAPPSANTDTDTSSSTTQIRPSPQKARTISEIKRSVAGLTQSASFPTPLQYSGSLDDYESFDVTSVIGREFPKLQITEILNQDAKIRDLAILGVYKAFTGAGRVTLFY